MTWLSVWKRLRPGDGLVLAAILVGWRLLAGAGGEDVAPPERFLLHVPIGEISESLRPDRELAFQGRVGPVRLAVRDGVVHVEETGCPHQLCRRMGPIARPGETVCCVPGGWWARIEPAGRRPEWDGLSR